MHGVSHHIKISGRVLKHGKWKIKKKVRAWLSPDGAGVGRCEAFSFYLQRPPPSPALRSHMRNLCQQKSLVRTERMYVTCFLCNKDC